MESAAVAALTARGVAGEVARDGHVPVYGFGGQQPDRAPTKDKSGFATIQERPEWARVPKHRTATELKAARRAERRPDLSYDIDGDGAVGPADYLIGKLFSKERDHRLNTAEGCEAVRALEGGLLDKYSFGHEQAGSRRPFPVKQVRGKIINADNMAQQLHGASSRPATSAPAPQTRTKSELVSRRRTELVDAAKTLQSAWEKDRPYFVVEPPVPRSAPARPGRSCAQRRDEYRREARQYAGLDDDTVHENPLRASQEVGLGLRDGLSAPTRTALLQLRRQAMLDEQEASLREAQENNFLPHSARHLLRNLQEEEQFREDPMAMTRTKLRQQRKDADIEHNRTHFEPPPPDKTRYADTQQGWWTLKQSHAKDPPTSLLKELTETKRRETHVKVTDDWHDRWGPRPASSVPLSSRGLSDGGSAGRRPQTADIPWEPYYVDDADHRTKRRFTEDHVPPGVAARMPRFFDAEEQKQLAHVEHEAAGLAVEARSSSSSAPRAGPASAQPSTAREWRLHVRQLESGGGDHEQTEQEEGAEADLLAGAVPTTAPAASEHSQASSKASLLLPQAANTIGSTGSGGGGLAVPPHRPREAPHHAENPRARVTRASSTVSQSGLRGSLRTARSGTTMLSVGSAGDTPGHRPPLARKASTVASASGGPAIQQEAAVPTITAEDPPMTVRLDRSRPRPAEDVAAGEAGTADDTGAAPPPRRQRASSGSHLDATATPRPHEDGHPAPPAEGQASYLPPAPAFHVPRPPSAAAPTPHFAVRTGGFQWLDKHVPQPPPAATAPAAPAQAGEVPPQPAEASGRRPSEQPSS